MSEPYGPKWRVPFAYFDPNSCTWRTCQPSLELENLPEPSPTWPTSGMWDLGYACELPMWVRPTDDNESSSSPGELIPTPLHSDAGPRGGTTGYGLRDWSRTLLPTPTASDRFGAGEHGDGGADLRTTVSLLPTPTANDWKGPNRSGSGSASSHGVATVAETFLSTPTASDQSGYGDLSTRIERLLPTPRATDGEKGGPNQRGSSGDLMLPSAVMALLPTPRVVTNRTSRSAAVMKHSRSGPSLEQAIDLAQGILPREFTSWEELPPSWIGDRTPPPSNDGNEY